MVKIKKINNEDLIKNFNESKDLFNKINESLPIIIKNQPSIDFMELKDIDNIINSLRKSINEIKNNFYQKDDLLKDFTNEELLFFSKKTNISIDLIQDILEFSNDLENYNFNLEFNKIKEDIFENIKMEENLKEKENKKLININILENVDLLINEDDMTKDNENKNENENDLDSEMDIFLDL